MAQKLEKFRTAKGVAVYPRLNQPDTKYKPEGEYSAKIRLSEEDAAPILTRITEIMEENFKNVKATLLADTDPKTKGKSVVAAKALKMADAPYKKCVDDQGEETGEVEFNVKMKASYTDKKTGRVVPLKPALFDAASPPNPLPASAQIWGGSLIKVAGEYNPFYTALLGAGISLRLSAVQVIKLVSSSGGDASSFGFGGEEGGFEAEGSEFADGDAEKAPDVDGSADF